MIMKKPVKEQLPTDEYLFNNFIKEYYEKEK